jgi:hypothetical protein
MQTEISPYDATGYRDEHERLALRRANIMHLVDLKRGGYSPRRTEMRIGLTGRPRSISILSKSVPPVACRYLPPGPLLGNIHLDRTDFEAELVIQSWDTAHSPESRRSRVKARDKW